MYKILVSDSLPAEILSRYNKVDGVSVVNKSGISMDDLKKEIVDYDGLVVRSRTKVTPDIIEAAQKLKVIGRAGAGVDNVDTSEATKRGIIVMNTPGGNTMAATEHTIALMLAGLRNIARANASMMRGEWNRKSFVGHELYQKTIGIVGLGKIGQEVAKRLKAFDTKLIGFDPILTSETADMLGVKLVDLDTLLKESDIITIHAPKMPETIDMLNARNMQQCKDGVIVVNCARGGIVNEKDLISLLDSGKVGMACIDVFSSEPPEDFNLAQHAKVVATPHLGASTEEAQTKVADQILEQMIEYFQKNVARNAVNFRSVEANLQPIIAPFYQVAERMGSIFNVIKPGRLKEVNVRYYGEVLTVPVEPITSYLLVGALRSPDGVNINPVNALTIARERGISIEIAKKDSPLTVHTNAIACDLTTDKGKIHLAGSTMGLNIYHLIEYGDFNLSAELVGNILIVENDNVPGIIGKVGTILGDADINISHVSSGRDGDSNKALNVFNVQGEISETILKKVKEVPGINQVHFSIVS